METLYHFQINPDSNRMEWDNVQAHAKPFADRVTAVHFAKRLSRIFKAEVRLTEGADPFKANGCYFHHRQQ